MHKRINLLGAVLLPGFRAVFAKTSLIFVCTKTSLRENGLKTGQENGALVNFTNVPISMDKAHVTSSMCGTSSTQSQGRENLIRSSFCFPNRSEATAIAEAT
jgi:hypothetical protein